MPKTDAYWDKMAKGYAKSPVGDETTYQRKLAETQEFLSPHMQVVEFGCGTGSTALVHAPFVQSILATDISANMLEIGRSKAEAAGIQNIQFQLGNLIDLHLEAESVDAVLGLNVLHLIPDRQEIIAEAARILKPGGVFVTSTVCMRTSPLRFIKLLVPLGKLLRLLPDIVVMSEAELADDITSAGFAIERQWQHAKGGIAVFIIARRV